MDNQQITETDLLKINALNCPIRDVLEILGGKWAFSIVYALLDGKKRFKELERSIEGINTRMLVKELKSMEANKIIIREAYATVPLEVCPQIQRPYDRGNCRMIFYQRSSYLDCFI